MDSSTLNAAVDTQKFVADKNGNKVDPSTVYLPLSDGLGYFTCYPLGYAFGCFNVPVRLANGRCWWTNCSAFVMLRLVSASQHT